MQFWKIKIACVTVLVAAGQAQAGIMLTNDSSLSSLGTAQDGFNITRDLDNNRDWLDFTLTAGSYSFNSIAPLLASGGVLEGWRYATALDFEQLGQAAGIPVSVIDHFAATAPSQLVDLESALGTTRAFDTSSFAVFDEASPSTTSFKRLGGITINSSSGAILDIPNDPHVWLNQSWDPNLVTATVGVALVRDNAVVPEPTSIALWGLGTLGFGAMARRRKRKQQELAA